MPGEVAAEPLDEVVEMYYHSLSGKDSDSIGSGIHVQMKVCLLLCTVSCSDCVLCWQNHLQLRPNERPWSSGPCRNEG